MEIVKAYYDLLFNQNRPRDVVDRYMGTEYIQHNPHTCYGKEVLIEYFE